MRTANIIGTGGAEWQRLGRRPRLGTLGDSDWARTVVLVGLGVGVLAVGYVVLSLSLDQGGRGRPASRYARRAQRSSRRHARHS
jgi:hypothetical protein